MKRLERKWARLAIIMAVVAVCSLILIMITKWMIWYIPPRWDSSVHYRCRNCRRIIYYDDDGDVEEAEI